MNNPCAYQIVDFWYPGILIAIERYPVPNEDGWSPSIFFVADFEDGEIYEQSRDEVRVFSSNMRAEDFCNSRNEHIENKAATNGNSSTEAT